MENKEKNFISAVVYVHNGEGQVARCLEMLIGVLEEHFAHGEIICVNDASEDGSLEQIREAGKTASSISVSVVNLSYYHGRELAMNAGMDLAIGDFVFEFDHTAVDYRAEDIMKLYERALEGYDIVCAAPDRKERFTSRIFYWVFSKFSDRPYRMRTESFRLLSRRVINRISAMTKAVPYRKAVYADCGLRMDILSYHPVKSEENSRADRSERRYRAHLAVDSLVLFTSLGYRVSAAMAGLMMLFSLLIMAYSLVIYLTAHPVAGWTTTILFLSVVFFGLFFVLTVMMKYMQLLLHLVFRRKNYSFESIEKLTK